MELLLGRALSDSASPSATVGLPAIPRHTCSLRDTEGLLVGAGQRKAQRDGCRLPEDPCLAETVEASLKSSATQGPTPLLILGRTLLSFSCFCKGRQVKFSPPFLTSFFYQ